MTVAALFVEPDGVYAGLDNVELWDQARDARLYAGPWPVVAHPPCARWSVLAPLVESLQADGRDPARYRVGADGGCFEAALAAVRTFGGVLEHPAHSLAWGRWLLPYPRRGYWSSSLTDGGWTTEVDQAAYGHPAQKRTWLYVYGVVPPPLDWSSPAVDRQVSSFPPGGRAGGKPAVLERERVRPKLAASTPPAFRDELLSIARSVS